MPLYKTIVTFSRCEEVTFCASDEESVDDALFEVADSLAKGGEEWEATDPFCIGEREAEYEDAIFMETA